MCAWVLAQCVEHHNYNYINCLELMFFKCNVILYIQNSFQINYVIIFFPMVCTFHAYVVVEESCIGRPGHLWGFSTQTSLPMLRPSWRAPFCAIAIWACTPFPTRGWKAKKTNLKTFLSSCLSIFLSICLSIYLSIYLRLSISISLSISGPE